MVWIVSSLVYCLLDITQGIMGILVGVYESIGIDIGYDASDTSPNNLFSYTFLTSETTPKGAFDSIFPQAALFIPVFTYMAYVIVLLAFVFSIYKMFFSSDQNNLESPGKLVGRFFLSIFTITWSYAIFIYLEKIAQVVYTEVNTVYLQVSGSVSDSFLAKVTDMDINDSFIKLDSVLDTFLTANSIYTILLPLLCIGFFFTMLWNYTKLLLEVVERYVLLGVMFYTCPLAFSSIISSQSEQLFHKWTQMLLSQFLLMVFNLFFVGIFNAAIVTVYTKSAGDNYVFASLGDFVFKNFCLIAWLMIGQRMDQHLNDLGFSVAKAGGGMAGAILTTAAAVVQGAQLGVAGAKLGKDVVGAAKDTIASRKGEAAGVANGMLGTAAGAKDGKIPISKAGTAENAAKVEGIQGRDASTGRLTPEGVKEAFNAGATLTGDDAKRAAEVMGLPQTQFNKARNIDWDSSEVNRDGAIFMSSTSPGDVDSHIGFGSDWTGKAEDGTPLAQMPVPTSEGFAEGSRVMTDTDLASANSAMLDQLEDGKVLNGSGKNVKWTTPSGNPITNADGSYTDEALNSPYFVGSYWHSPNQKFVAGLDNVNSFDLDRGGEVEHNDTAAYGDMPKMSFGIQRIDGNQSATPASYKQVLNTTSQASSGADAVLKRKDHPATEAYNEMQRPSAANEFAENLKDRRDRRRHTKKRYSYIPIDKNK